MLRPLPLVLVLSACAGADTLDLPEDPARAGASVGVRTLSLGGQTVDLWYPARGPAGTSDVRLTDYLPDAFVAALGDLELTTWTQRAAVDARPLQLEEPLPLVIFSHGFGGFRAQSTQLTAHLASRGYVVVSADHPGRDLATLSPCLLEVEGLVCDALGAFGDDPAIEDLTAVLDALGDLPEDVAALTDLDTIGMFGHSAGGNSTSTLAAADARIDAALPMAGGSAFTLDVPGLLVGGSCDAIIPPERLEPEGDTYTEGYLSVDGAGHLAFSDLCLADLGGLGDQLVDLEGANPLFISQLDSLATDGCPGAEPTLDAPTCDAGFAPLEETDPALRYVVTTFFDATLKGIGGGPDAEAYDVLRTP